MILTCGIFAQSSNYILKAGNQRYIDSTGINSGTSHYANVFLFDVRLENHSSDTLEYSGGQIYLQTDSACFNGGEPVFYLLDTQLPEGLLFSEVAAYTVGDSVQLCCPNKRFIGRGHGYKVAPGGNVLIGNFGLKTTAANGFATETVNIRWRDYLNSDNPLTKITVSKANKLVSIYKDCSYVVGQ